MTTRQSPSKHMMPIDTLGRNVFFVLLLFRASAVSSELTASECGSEKVISEVDDLKVIFN